MIRAEPAEGLPSTGRKRATECPRVLKKQCLVPVPRFLVFIVFWGGSSPVLSVLLQVDKLVRCYQENGFGFYLEFS